MNAEEILDREFLEIRSRILDVAAALDRQSSASGSIDQHTNRQRIDQAIQILLSNDANRAEQIQLLFSRPYDPNWREP